MKISYQKNIAICLILFSIFSTPTAFAKAKNTPNTAAQSKVKLTNETGAQKKARKIKALSSKNKNKFQYTVTAINDQEITATDAQGKVFIIHKAVNNLNQINPDQTNSSDQFVVGDKINVFGMISDNKIEAKIIWNAAIKHSPASNKKTPKTKSLQKTT